MFVMLLLNSDFSLVDKTGRPLRALPRPNWNDHLTCKPPAGSCFVRLGDQK